MLKWKFVLLLSNFRETITLGCTDFTETEIKKLVDNLGEDYPGSTYHLYKKWVVIITFLLLKNSM